MKKIRPNYVLSVRNLMFCTVLGFEFKLHIYEVGFLILESLPPKNPLNINFQKHFFLFYFLMNFYLGSAGV
jgi:hypothetical protein